MNQTSRTLAFDALTAHSEPFEVRIELAPASR
jgi:hypothetical protein